MKLQITNYKLQISELRGLPRSNALATRGRSPREQVSSLWGQSLFEVILALAVLAIILTAIVSLTSRSVSTSTLSKNKAQANRYASEAIEYLRTQKEFMGWKSFKTNLGTGDWCVPSLPTTLPFSDHSVCASDTSDYIAGTIFKRQLLVTADTSTPPKSVLNIDIKVIWTDEKGTHETYTISAISDW